MVRWKGRRLTSLRLTSSFSQQRAGRSFKMFTSLDSSMQRLVADSDQVCIVFQDHRHAPVGDDHVVSAGASLLVRGGPLTVVRFVVPVAVLALQRVAWWTRTHVGKKSSRIIEPTCAHCDATASVDWIFRVARVSATRLRMGVGSQLRCLGSTRAVSVSQRSEAKTFNQETAATSSSACTNRVQVRLEIVSAIAAKCPPCVPSG